jgi:hypothetical protein
MISTHYLAALGGSLSIALALGSGAEVVSVLTTPAPITATARVIPYQSAAGDVVTLTWDIQKNVDCPGYSARVWDGESGFHMSEAVRPTSLPKGQGIYKIPTEIPAMAPVGILTLRIVGHFDCPSATRSHFVIGPVNLEIKP